MIFGEQIVRTTALRYILIFKVRIFSNVSSNDTIPASDPNPVATKAADV